MVCTLCGKDGHNKRTCTMKTLSSDATEATEATDATDTTDASEATDATVTASDEKEACMAEILENPHSPDWDRLAERYQRTSATIQRWFWDRVSPEEHVRMCIEKMTPDILSAIVNEIETQCTECRRPIYSYPKKWEDRSYCVTCHDRLYLETIQERWKEVTAYSQQNAMTNCKICNVDVIYDGTVCTRYHFDHVNMFEKTDSISMMVTNGTPMYQIEAELTQCQVLCVSCHAAVTAIERKCGFVRLKKVNTREKKETENHSKENADRYRAFMDPIYDRLRTHLQTRKTETDQ